MQVDELLVSGDMISQHCISELNHELNNQISCEFLNTEHIEANRIHISHRLQAKQIKVQFISPLPGQNSNETDNVQHQNEEELIQRSENTIKFHGSMVFQKGVIHSSDPSQTEFIMKKSSVQIEPELLQIRDVSQWVDIESNEFSENTIGWQIILEEDIYKQNQSSQIEIKNVKRQIKFFHEEQKDNFIDKPSNNKKKEIKLQFEKFDFDQVPFEETLIIAKKKSIIQYSYTGLPSSHTYVQLKGNFYFLSDLWRDKQIAWCKIDNQLVWMNPIKKQSNQLLCEQMTQLNQYLNNDNHQKDAQKLINIIQEQYWSLPIQIAQKHMKESIVIEFGVNIGDLPNNCNNEERLLFEELESQLFLFGFDDFQLSYK